MNFLNSIFGGLGQSLAAQEQAAVDAATQAFYVIAGELLVILIVLGFLTFLTYRQGA